MLLAPFLFIFVSSCCFFNCLISFVYFMPLKHFDFSSYFDCITKSQTKSLVLKFSLCYCFTFSMHKFEIVCLSQFVNGDIFFNFLFGLAKQIVNLSLLSFIKPNHRKSDANKQKSSKEFATHSSIFFESHLLIRILYFRQPNSGTL